jgi:AcrR family transcriptional regulator
MSDSLEEQKNKKKQSIMSAAYHCFMEKGIHKSSIDEIVQKANVAKGTFYLYFSDKADLMQQLCIHISKSILIDAYKKMKENESPNFIENVISIIDYAIEYFKSHKLVLKMLERNFSWPLIENELSREQDDLMMAEMLNALFSQSRVSKDEVYKILFSIIALAGSVGYSSILFEKPDTIDNMKPVLYGMITKILS